MKKYLSLVLLLPVLLNSQWKIDSKSNKFDGEYKMAYVIGTSKNYLYNAPVLRINSLGSEPNLYIGNIGYTGCSSAQMEVTFDDFDEILVYGSSSNTGNDAAFFNLDYREMIELFQLLKDKKKLYIRYSNNCGNEDFTFNLIGSTKAIDYVTKEYLKDQQIRERLEEENRIRVEEEKEERAQEKADIINQEKSEFAEVLKNHFDFGEVGMDGSLVEKIFSFKVNSTKRIKVFSKKKPKESIYYDKTELFFESDNNVLEIYNRIRDNSILLETRSTSGRLVCSYYVGISELKKLTDDIKVEVIEELWPKLIEFCE